MVSGQCEPVDLCSSEMAVSVCLDDKWALSLVHGLNWVALYKYSLHQWGNSHFISANIIDLVWVQKLV